MRPEHPAPARTRTHTQQLIEQSSLGTPAARQLRAQSSQELARWIGEQANTLAEPPLDQPDHPNLDSGMLSSDDDIANLLLEVLETLETQTRITLLTGDAPLPPPPRPRGRSRQRRRARPTVLRLTPFGPALDADQVAKLTSMAFHHRQIIALHTLYGLSFAEIAEMLVLPERVVRLYYAHAQRALAQHTEPDEQPPQSAAG